MKIHTFIFSVSAASLATNAFAEAPTVKYDRFTQTTDLSSKAYHKMQVPQPHADVVMVSASIKEGKLVTLELNFGTVGNHWQYLACHTIHFLVDGKPYADLGAGKFINRMEGSATEELLILPMTREQLAKLAAAGRIEYEVCNDEKVFDKEDLAVLRDFGPSLDQALKGTPAGDSK